MPSARHQGFTLIEMIMVISILGIIVAMASPLLTQGLSAFTAGENIIEANWQGQLALERMTRDIMMIRSASSITTISASNFAFTDLNGNTISYALSGTNLILTWNGNAVVLAEGIQSVTFTYFDATGATTSTASLVRLVRITLNVTQNNVNYTLTTAAYPRNVS